MPREGEPAMPFQVQRISLFICSLSLLLLSTSARSDELFGGQETVFSVGAHKAFVIQPSKPAAASSMPWVWFAPTIFGANQLPRQSHGWLLRHLIESGWVVGGIDVGESWGSPAGRKAYTDFYDYVTRQYKLAPKACLLAQSRGGLMLYNWAADNPQKVRCLAALLPVCDIHSFPGVKKAAPAYNMTPEELDRHLAEHNPIDRLKPLADAGIPIFQICGDSDTLVPADENSQVVYNRYKALGGQIDMIIIKGKGHVDKIPEYFQCPQLLKFIMDHK
jgi:hypothetical protein